MSEEEQNSIQEVLTKDIDDIKATMDASVDMMCLTKDQKVVYVNKNYLRFAGGELTDYLEDRRFRCIHLDDIADVTEVLISFAETQKPYRVKYRLLSSDNTYKWVVEDGRPFFDEDGASLGCVSKCVDIDKEKKMEIKLHSAETKYRRLFETAHDGILILDSVTGEITDVNPFLIDLLGYTRDEFLGKKLWEVGAFKNIKASKEAFKILQEVGYVRYEDLPLETFDGNLIPVEFVSNAYVAGNIKVMQCNIRDISARKRAEISEKELAMHQQEKLKNAFIADVTHELRTPLAIIKGNIELSMRDKNLGKKEMFEVLEAINVEVLHLSAMLLDLAILTTENQDIQKSVTFQKVRLDTLIKKTVERLSVLSKTKNITISINKLPALFIGGESKYLEKLFSNLVSNALFYGKENGTVKINAVTDVEHIKITITDDGLGISKEELPHIFGRFYRSRIAREVNHEGTGLGLAISKWIVDAHHGEISVQSTINKGTTFTVQFPLSH